MVQHEILRSHLADIYTFLSPILQTVEETTRTIECFKEKDAEQQPTKQEIQQDQGQDLEQTQQEQTQANETNEQMEVNGNNKEVRFDLLACQKKNKTENSNAWTRIPQYTRNPM